MGSFEELAACAPWRAGRPMAILATGPHLDAGSLSRAALLACAPDARNVLLLTQRPRLGSLADRLAGHAGPSALVVEGLPVTRRVPLEGDELAAWEAERARARDAAGAGAADAGGAMPDGAVPGGARDDGRPGSSEGAAGTGGGVTTSAPGGAGGAAGQGALRTSSVGLSSLVRGAGGELVQVLPEAGAAPGGGEADPVGGGGGGVHAGVLMEGFAPPLGAAGPMFPDEDDALTAAWDVYGEVIDADAWRKARRGQAGRGPWDGREGTALPEACQLWCSRCVPAAVRTALCTPARADDVCPPRVCSVQPHTSLPLPPAYHPPAPRPRARAQRRRARRSQRRRRPRRHRRAS